MQRIRKLTPLLMTKAHFPLVLFFSQSIFCMRVTPVQCFIIGPSLHKEAFYYSIEINFEYINSSPLKVYKNPFAYKDCMSSFVSIKPN